MIWLSIISFLSIIVSTALSLKGIVNVSIILLLVLITIVLRIKHRIKHQWGWRGVKGKQLYKVIALTTLYVAMIPGWIVHSFHGTSRVNGRGQFNC